MARASDLTSSRTDAHVPAQPGGRRRAKRDAAARRAGVRNALIVVQNLPVPLDRRVWQEAGTLRDAGYAVTVVCPKGGEHQKTAERLDDIDIRRFGVPIEGRSQIGVLLEYATTALSILFAVTREALRRRPHVVQVCNPPDFLIFLVLHLKLLLGTKIVFDHHDLCPELYEAKFGQRGMVYDALRLLERLTFRLADVVIANNASFATIAKERGKVDPERLWIAHSYMKSAAIERDVSRPSPASGPLTLGYLGVIGSQDGVDVVIGAMARLRRDSAIAAGELRCVVVGDGPELARMRGLAKTLGVADVVRFTGFLTGRALWREIEGFDIAVVPDPPNAMNTRLSMNKVFEYMSVGAPIVHLGLEQAGGDAGPAGIVAATPDSAGLAAAIEALMRDPETREQMGRAALERARRFTWESQESSYLAAYARALGGQAAKPAPVRATG